MSPFRLAAWSVALNVACCNAAPAHDSRSPRPDDATASTANRQPRMIALPASARLLHSMNARVGEPEQRVIRDSEGWNALWSQLYAGLVPPPLPAVDFSRELVAFITPGGKPTAGFDIDVEGTSRGAVDALRVHVVETVPAADCMLAQVMTAPAVAVRLPRVRGEVQFIIRRVTQRC